MLIARLTLPQMFLLYYNLEGCVLLYPFYLLCLTFTLLNDFSHPAVQLWLEKETVPEGLYDPFEQGLEVYEARRSSIESIGCQRCTSIHAAI